MTWGIAQEKGAVCVNCGHEHEEHPEDGKCLHELCDCPKYLNEIPPLDPGVRPPEERMP